MLLASCTHFLAYMVMNCTQRSRWSPTPFSDCHTVTADNNTRSIMHPVVFAAALNCEFQLNWHPSRRDGSRRTAAGRTDGGVTAGVVGGFKVELTDHNLPPCLTKQRLRKDTPSSANKAMYRMHTTTVNSAQHHLISIVAVEVADWRWYNFFCHNPPSLHIEAAACWMLSPELKTPTCSGTPAPSCGNIIIWRSAPALGC